MTSQQIAPPLKKKNIYIYIYIFGHMGSLIAVYRVFQLQNVGFSSLTRDQTLGPLLWEHGISTTAPSRKSRQLHFYSRGNEGTCLHHQPNTWQSYNLNGEVKVAQSCLTLCNPRTIQSRGFSRSENWSGQSFPSLGDLPNPGIEPVPPTLQTDSLPAEPPGKPNSNCSLIH